VFGLNYIRKGTIFQIIFEAEKEEKKIMKQPPKKLDEPFFAVRKYHSAACRVL
jgi:hypothetical protein